MENPVLVREIRDGRRTPDELRHLIRKLRWMGMENEAKQIQARLAVSSILPAGLVIMGSGTRHDFFCSDDHRSQL